MRSSLPSKRGSDRSHTAAAVVSDLVTGTDLTTAPSTPPVFDPGELARSLRRGAEVDLFNRLAARQDALTAEESDELYLYRLRRLLTRIRQLERSSVTDDEAAIVENLADFRGRLEELRRFEGTRRSAGLSAGYEIDAGAEERALNRLVELASRRPRGLVAGDEELAVQPTGSVRLREEPFAPSSGDVPVYVLVPPSLPADALLRNVQAVSGQGARIRCVRDLAEIPQTENPPLILNWGSTQLMPAEAVALNRPDAVRIASDQVESLERLRELAPRTVCNPDDIGLLGGDQLVAKQRHGSRGSGKAIVSIGAPATELAGYDCYQQFVAGREFRVSILNDQVVSAYLKRPAEGAAPSTLRPDWTFERCQILPKAVVAAAREAARRIGLDYAGIDIIQNQQTGRVYCLEANAAPGMSEETLRSLYAHIQETLRRRVARAG